MAKIISQSVDNQSISEGLFTSNRSFGFGSQWLKVRPLEDRYTISRWVPAGSSPSGERTQNGRNRRSLDTGTNLAWSGKPSIFPKRFGYKTKMEVGNQSLSDIFMSIFRMAPRIPSIRKNPLFQITPADNTLTTIYTTSAYRVRIWLISNPIAAYPAASA